MSLVQGLANVFGITIALLTLSALLIWMERRLLAVWQDRYGPNRVGPFGLLQVVADAIKLLTKDDWIPPFADKPVFVIAPALVVISALLGFAVVPIAPGIGIADLNIGVLFFLAMASLSVYSVVLGGWASNNKYSLLGALRAGAQMLSYEVFLGIAIMGVVMLAGSFNLREIVIAQQSLWYIVLQPLGFLVFVIAGIAQTHRLPFDLPEGENELIGGFHTEYSGMKFGLFFVGEYIGILVIAALAVTLFFGGWLGPAVGPIGPVFWFSLKTLLFVCFFFLLRATLARPRYDKLLAYGWKLMLPLALINLAVTATGVLWFDGRI